MQQVSYNTNVIVSVGSDTSFDLIIEVLPLNKHKKISLEIYPPSIKHNAEQILFKINDRVDRIIANCNNSFNIKIFNKVPDIFVWLGRFEGAVSKVIEYEHDRIRQEIL